MEEFSNQITQRTGISVDQARQMVDVVTDDANSKLPAPLASRVNTAL